MLGRKETPNVLGEVGVLDLPYLLLVLGVLVGCPLALGGGCDAATRGIGEGPSVLRHGRGA